MFRDKAGSLHSLFFPGNHHVYSVKEATKSKDSCMRFRPPYLTAEAVGRQTEKVQDERQP